AKFVRDVVRDLTIRVETRRQRARDDADRRKRWDEASELALRQARLDRASGDLRRVEESLKIVEGQASVERELKPLRVIERSGDPSKPFRPNRPLLLLA